MKKSLNCIFTFLVIVFFTACATKYQPLSYTGGYSETRISEDTFNVYFKGNGRVTFERSNDFTLLRSAELAIMNGYNYFEVVNSNNRTALYLNADISNSGDVNLTSIGKPRTHYLVKFYKNKPLNIINLYEAKFIINSIKTKYDLKD